MRKEHFLITHRVLGSQLCQIKLSDVLALKDIEDLELRENLAYSYDQPGCNSQLFAVMLNSIYAQLNQVFLLSRRLMVDLLSKDPQVKIKTVNGTQYKFFMGIMTKKGFLEMLREPTRRKAGVYKLIHPEMVADLYRLNSKEFFEAQEQFALELYDKNQMDEEAFDRECQLKLKNMRKALLKDGSEA